jgi:hypothetical protein
VEAVPQVLAQPTVQLLSAATGGEQSTPRRSSARRRRSGRPRPPRRSTTIRPRWVPAWASPIRTPRWSSRKLKGSACAGSCVRAPASTESHEVERRQRTPLGCAGTSTIAPLFHGHHNHSPLALARDHLRTLGARPGRSFR